MTRETAAQKKQRLAAEAAAAAKTPDELTEDALAEVADTDEPGTNAEPEQEAVKPALKDTSLMTISEGGRRRVMRVCDYQAEQAAEAEAEEEADES